MVYCTPAKYRTIKNSVCLILKKIYNVSICAVIVNGRNANSFRRNELNITLKYVLKFLLDNIKNLVDFTACCDLDTYYFNIETLHGFNFFYLFQFAHFCKNLENGSMNLFDTFALYT